MLATLGLDCAILGELLVAKCQGIGVGLVMKILSVRGSASLDIRGAGACRSGVLEMNMVES